MSSINAVACRRAAELFEQAHSHGLSDAYDSEAEAKHSAHCLAEFAALQFPNIQQLDGLIDREKNASQMARREDRQWQHKRAASALVRLRDEIWPQAKDGAA